MEIMSNRGYRFKIVDSLTLGANDQFSLTDLHSTIGIWARLVLVIGLAAASESIDFENSRASGLTPMVIIPIGRPDRRRGTEDHALKVLAKQLVVAGVGTPSEHVLET
jgi:hypothetical protein